MKKYKLFLICKNYENDKNNKNKAEIPALFNL